MTNREIFHRFLRYVWPFRWYLLFAFIGMILLAATNGAIAYSVKPILDDIFIKQDKSMLYYMPFIILAIFGIRGVAYFVQSYAMAVVGERVVRILQVELYSHMLELDVNLYASKAPGSFISRVTYDTNLLRSTASSTISNLFREGFTILFLIGVLFYQNLNLALMSLVGLPLSGFLIVFFGKKVRRLSKTRQELMEVVTSHLEESFAGIRIVKAFGMEGRERSLFRAITKKVLKNNMRTAKVKAITNPSMDLVAGVAICAVVYYGGKSVISEQLTTGEFFSFVTALLMAYTPIKRFSGLNNALQVGMAAARRIFEMMDSLPEIRDPDEPQSLSPIQKNITFRDVTFSYDSSESPVLNTINLEVSAGETVALVGSSGSGKTTLVHLLPRFYDVSSGSVEVDGVDIRTVSLRSLRAQIAMVTQEIILFNDTIRNNISYGENNRSFEEIKAAADGANALAFIEAFPEGFDTQIGSRGVKLSGGQRQRISIARSILKNAPILILDEATSALDNESERAVQVALERLMSNRTTLVIAHRLSTIRNANRIIVLSEGRIVEEGTHEALLEADGEYARFHALQFENDTTP
ncbi:MAG: lipid A export permease/ATP-binding protein MsbA [Magnetococcales bacterium]|nr:lipid A export permease/ATP-binding protein MsbA [Magnetococcales bacterium]